MLPVFNDLLRLIYLFLILKYKIVLYCKK